MGRYKDMHIELTSNCSEDVTSFIKQLLKDSVEEKGLQLEDVICFPNIGKTFKTNLEAKNHILRNKDIIKDDISGCHFIEGNKAWVSSHDKATKVVRYFSKDIFENEYFYLDVFDIYYLFTGKAIWDALIDIMDLLNIKSKEQEWKERQKDKYLNNLKTIKNFNNLKDRYPDVYKLLSKELLILELINIIGLTKIRSKFERVDNESMFYSSTRHIGGLINIDNRKIGRVLDFFCLLGIIKKVDYKCIPDKLRKRAEKEIEDKRRNKADKEYTPNMINYYIIYEMDSSLLGQAQRIAGKARGVCLTVSSISEDRVKALFGQGMSELIYINNSTRKKYKKSLKDTHKNNRIYNDIDYLDDYDDIPF